MADLVVDLHDLWFAEQSCTEMAQAHTQAASTVGGCDAADALDRPAGIGLGSSGFYSDWSYLRDQIVGMLTTNASSLDDSAAAMRICIDTFTSTDADVAQDFKERQAAIPYE
ncbi:hypothetical protein [Nocardioides sp. 1609]|uniref:hypothetical protein n=1 Tax=Nocardioides sp. 1609 TaxID=2508327 RepID=UPI00106F29B6|nr:hypothetical protein [Nocardioides sp. 1609]